MRFLLSGLLIAGITLAGENCVSEFCQYKNFFNATGNQTLKPKPFPKFAVPVPPPKQKTESAPNSEEFMPTSKLKKKSFETAGKTIPIANVVTIKHPSAMVEVSLTDLNRIVCPGNLEKFAYSKEKQVKIVKSKNELYVKFLPVEVWNAQKGRPEVIYRDFPRDLFVKCEGQTFSLVLIPKKGLPPQVIYLQVAKSEDNKEAKKFEESLPYEKLIAELIKDAYKDKIPQGYEVEVKAQPFREFKELSLVELKDYIGSSFKVRVFAITAKQNISLHEKMFIPYFPNAVAIAIEKPALKKNEMTRLFVIEKKAF
jgi:hypothetical protein